MAQWSVSMQKLAEQAGSELELVTQKATLDLFTAVVRRSPVDTGRFRANWNVSQGSPNTSAVLEGPVSPSHADAELARAAALPAGGITYLANGLPYAEVLENGSSKQAPNGMVRVSVVEFERFVDKATK